jgi:hypothetical protein
MDIDINIDYIYISTLKDINKINLLKKEHKYLPYIKTNEILNENLKNKNILICFKNINKIYAYTKITNIVSNTNKIFNTLINKFSLSDAPELYFLKFDNMKIYNIKLNDFNNYLKLQKNNPIKYPMRMNIFNLDNFKNDSIIFQLNNFIKDESDESDIEDSNKIIKIDDKDILSLDVPINWICCNNLIELMNKNNIDKEMLKNHYLFCSKCIKTNNNDIDINWNEKKINIRKIKSKKKMNKIIDYYLKAKNFNLNEQANDIIEIDKINLFYYKKSEELYNNTIMILNKS